MVGIAAVSISNTSAPAASTSQVSDTEKTESGSSALQVDTSKLRGDGQAKGAEGAEGSSGSGEPAHITQLREMIKKLQKQLADEQKQLAILMAQKTDETTKLAAVAGKQASIATLSGEIQAATAQLLEALQKTGGNSAGGMVDTQA
ncbi:hypothetical protein [Pseudomonas putida]|uniref:Uncharacterized protein n=1 Tax=Pseudomonas putida TaxID=303 RepID=A0A6I6XKX9_PSEPU|nr:hypothetical protein [Pseudomonas putida]QHG64506.1 hypothetical protein C2H86_08805 [Pseudomonas putida]